MREGHRKSNPEGQEIRTELEETVSAHDAADGADKADGAEQLKENRAQLGVDETHKTPEMRRGKRGSYP